MTEKSYRERRHEEWVTLIFGSMEAYRRSLPARMWVRSDYGWTSQPR